jgi:WD40 repeat protein
MVWSGSGGDYDISIRLGTTAVADDQSGFFGCRLLSPDDLVAVSRSGGFSRWVDGCGVQCFSGHTAAVTGLTWTPPFGFMTVGLDNVGRVFCQDGDTFREFARPLIHGHAVFDVGAVDIDLYAFAADEKNVRLLRPTQCFARIVPGAALRGIALPFASMVPPLKLDNKIIQNADEVKASFAPLVASDFMKERVPNAHEMWLTRWPEVASLWGHQRELRRITVAPGQWIASGDDRGGVIVWRDFKMVGYLTEESKASTTAIAAAPDSSLVLLVLQNGIVKLVDPETAQIVQLLNCSDGQWAGGWATNSEYFAVGGRDGITVFERDGCRAAACDDLFVTAIEFIGNYEMLVGLDGGEIQQILFSPSERKFTVVRSYQRHGGRVNMIRHDRGKRRFLSAGSDHVVLIQPLILS